MVSRSTTSPSRSPRHVGLVLGYALNTGMLAIAGLTMIPALIFGSSLSDWASIAVGQAVGSLGGVVIGFGWGLMGPSYVASAGSEERNLRYRESLAGRFLISLLVLPALAAIAYLVAGANGGLGALGAVTTAMVGLGAGWYFVGRAMPWRLILLDTIPRVAGTGVAVGALYIGGTPVLALVVQFAGILVGVLLSSLWILIADSRGGLPLSLGALSAALGKQSGAVAATSISTLYTALPLTLVSIWLAPVLPHFAPLDKLQKQFASALSPIVQTFQGYMARGTPREKGARAKVTLLICAVCGLSIFVVFSLVGSYVVTWITNGQASLSELTIVLCAVGFVLMLLEQVLSHAVLTAIGRVGVLAPAALAGSAIGIASMLYLGGSLGLNGVQLGLVIGSVVTVGIESFGLIRWARSSNRRGQHNLK